jgi:outer membrane protein TolC
LQEVADQLIKLKTVRAQRASQDLAYAATSHNYKLFTARYHHGIADYVDVLTSKQSFMQQKAEQVNLQTHHLLAIVSLLKALGGNDIQKDVT